MNRFTKLLTTPSPVTHPNRRISMLNRMLIPGLAIALCASSASGAITHRYSFTSDATDSVGSADGTLVNGATVAGGQLVLAGGQGPGAQHAALDAGTIGINTYTDVTIEAWYTVNIEANWARVFDFGFTNGTGGNYIFLTHQNSNNGQMRAALSDTNPGFNNENQVDGGAQPDNTPIHVAVVYNDAADLMTLYVNGAAVGTNAATTIQLSALSNDNAFLGRALYNDPGLTGSIDEFRIYDNALSANDIQASFNAGADTLVPEPASLALLGIGGLLMSQRRRRD